MCTVIAALKREKNINNSEMESLSRPTILALTIEFPQTL